MTSRERRQRERRTASERPKPPCPACGHNRSVVVDVPGLSPTLAAYCRTRQCDQCLHRWSTYEVNEKPISGVDRSL